MRFLRHKRSFYLNRSCQISKEQKNWQIEKKNIQRQNDIKNEYNKLSNKNPFKITTGKLALWLFFIICIAVVIFIGWVTIAEISLASLIGVMPSFAPLTALAGTVFSTAIVLVGYFKKSATENSIGGITYEAAAAKDFDQSEQPLPGCPPTDDEQNMEDINLDSTAQG